MAKAYVYLVEQMHVALNTESPSEISDRLDAKDYYFYAEENYELGNLEQAKNYYTNVNKCASTFF